MEQYGEMKKNGREYYLSRRDRKPTAEEWASKAKDLAKKAEGIIAAQDEQGRWVRIVPKAEQVRDKEGRVRIEVDENTKLPMMYSNEFIKNVRALAEYISAAQGGPKFAR
jgi:hypothetical protein